jgi:hypothetical protein
MEGKACVSEHTQCFTLTAHTREGWNDEEGRLVVWLKWYSNYLASTRP